MSKYGEKYRVRIVKEIVLYELEDFKKKVSIYCCQLSQNLEHYLSEF